MFNPRCPLCRPHFRPPCLGDLHSSATEMATPPTVPVRQDYHADCEAAVNRLINLELHASYVYLSMAVHFNREDVALKNTAQFFLHQSRKEREKADGLMELQHQRGGRPNVREIKLERDEWASSREAMESAMLLAERVNQCLLDLHRLAVEKQDPYLYDFLQRHCLHEQVKFIRELGGHITTLQKMGVPGSGLAEYLFDKRTLGDGKN